jgi:hypothetical protein
VVRSGAKVTGKVKVKVDGKVVKRVSLRKGKAVVKVRITRVGRHRITAAYLGSSLVARSASTARIVTVT